jgi:integration host factor subunit beta
MVKSELIHLIANKQQNLPLEDIEISVNQIIEYLNQTLSKGGRIEIRDFGSFKLHHRSARNARNPKTGTKLTTGDKYLPRFKAGKALRNRVNYQESLSANKSTKSLLP